jgi:hypothetical protein
MELARLVVHRQATNWPGEWNAGPPARYRLERADSELAGGYQGCWLRVIRAAKFGVPIPVASS